MIVDVTFPFDIQFKIYSKSFVDSPEIPVFLTFTVCGTEILRTNGRPFNYEIQITEGMLGSELKIDFMEMNSIQ